MTFQCLIWPEWESHFMPSRWYGRARTTQSRTSDWTVFYICWAYAIAKGFGEALANGSLDYQLVKLVVEWKAPTRYDQVLELSVYATRLGNTSFTLATEFRIAARPEIIVTAETVNVVVEAHTLRKTPLPPDFRAALAKGAAGVITDHAGYLASAGSLE